MRIFYDKISFKIGGADGGGCSVRGECDGGEADIRCKLRFLMQYEKKQRGDSHMRTGTSDLKILEGRNGKKRCKGKNSERKKKDKRGP